MIHLLAPFLPQNADQLLLLVKDNGYRVDMILETHAHADHMTTVSYLQKRLSEEQGIDRPLIGIGKRIRQVQEMFGERYGIPPAVYQGAFDKLLDDDEVFHVGNMEAQAIHIPGHTPDHMGYRIGGMTIPQLRLLTKSANLRLRRQCVRR